ncbi:MAG: HEAT repeat domain-containing protein, partial [Planctomycetota bacterium]|nr:HEAT repeat domain-containing protein [Planctomycetota bacterium]
MLKLRVIRSLTVAALMASVTAFCESGPSQAALLEVLRTGASVEGKANACRELARVGTRDAVPALAGLLGDEKLAHRARQALECIPDPAVEDALRDAAPKLQGRLLMGVVCSLGARRDAKSVELLQRLLKDGDAEVVSAAAVALGKIGTPAAAKAIEQALAGAADAVKPALWDAGLRCAEALTAAGQRDEAVAIYDRLRASDAPFQVRVAATRGAVVARQSGGIALLTELLNGEGGAMFNLALQLVLELPGQDATRAVAAQIAKLAPERQALLVQAVGNRGDKAALPEVHTAARHNDAVVRMAAIRALTRLGDASSLPTLLDACGSQDKNVAAAAAAAIVKLPGGDVDAALIATVGKSDDAKNLAAIECLGRRNASSAAPALLKVAGEGEAAARLA